MMLGSVTLLILLGIFFSKLKHYYEFFMNIHKILFLVICLGAYLHGAFYFIYIGLSAVTFDLLTRGLLMMINNIKVESPQFELLGN